MLVRAVGWLFMLVGIGVSIVGFVLLAAPDATITLNGVPTKDTGPKLAFALFPLIHVGIGTGLAFAPSRYLDRVYLWQQANTQRFWERLAWLTDLVRGRK
ncbi:MAG: hypothetical protein AB1813_26790 [Verrucomicrobiota bacterium]